LNQIDQNTQTTIMLKSLPIVLFCLLAQYANATTIYVNANASGSNNGSSWANAYTSLQSGIAASTTGNQIWVAAGTYKPTTTTDETIPFQLPSGVGIYGGFAGTETLLTQRDWVSNQTILSGDIGATGVAGDNSRHVVVAFGVSSNTRLDGFKVISGYADDFSNNYYGGGMVVDNASLTVANCIFTSNYTNNGGAGLAQTNGGANTTGILNLINCSFTYNTGGAGTALYLRGTQTNLTHCNISNNDGEGAIYIDNATATFDRCIISGNNSTDQFGTIFVENTGGVINAYSCLFAGNLSAGASVLEIRFNSPDQHRLWNCTFSGNKSTDPSPDALFLSDLTSVRNCIIWGNYNGQGVAYNSSDVKQSIVQGGYTGTGNTNTDPLFVNPGNASQAPFDASAYDYRLLPASPGINGGNNLYTNNLYLHDLADSARISGITVDLGCYEKQFCTAANVTITASGPTSFCTGSFITLNASAANTYSWSNGATSGTTAVSAAGTYTVTVVDANGCLGTASKAVNVYPASVQITGNPVICNSTSTTLTATSANGTIFSWSSGQNTAAITVTQAATYTVTVTTANTCTASASVSVSAPIVSTPVITQNGNILSSSASSGNQWYLGGNLLNGATAQNYTATQSGNYTVIVTDGNGCTSAASNAVNVNINGIENVLAESITVYPNPATTALFIDAGALPIAEISIFNITGRLVSLIKAPQSKSLDISQLPAGAYLLEITSQGSAFRMQWIKM
jgi:hypothetical protein